MPYVRKTYRKKRPYRKRRAKPKRTYNRRAVVNLGNSIVPFSQKAKLTYCSNEHKDTSTAGVYANHNFNFIGAYDPDISGVGHQPMGFDQMMTLYDHYQVLGCKATFTIHYASGDCIIGLATSDTTTLPANLTNKSTFQENPGSLYKFVTQDTVSQSPIVLTKKISPAKFFGLKSALYQGEDKYQGSVSANPSETGGLHLVVWGNNSTTVEIRWSCRLEFIVQFTEPKPLIGS